MADYKFSDLVSVKFSPVNENRELHFHLTFASQESHPNTVQFRLSSAHAMAILNGLMTIQRNMGWPLPSYSRPSGKPSLSVVVDNSEDY
jgi:hypothetical protein